LIFIYALFDDAFRLLQLQMIRLYENGEMEVTWKEAVVAELGHYSSLPIRTEATHIQRKDHKVLQP